ncbi:MAG: DNA adenine methylase [Armatimonadota bacterium]
MNYIGSKFSLLPEIKRILDNNDIPANGIALDLFAGTGVVARFLKGRGHIAYANDWQYYSYLTCVAFIEHNELPAFETLLSDNCWKKEINRSHLLPDLPVSPPGERRKPDHNSPAVRVLSYLSRLPEEPGGFYNAYCEGGKSGRMYFSKENGLRIQAIRDKIELWHKEQLITPEEKGWLVASLIESADRVANTASVYGAYLKHVKLSARKPMRLHLLDPVPSEHDAEQHRAFCMDSESMLSALDQTRIKLVYIDPPYNSRQYNANYHILETIARWDLAAFEPRGVTGLRKWGERKSKFCLKTKAGEAFRRLFSAMNSEYVLFSYNNEGLLSRNELEALFDEFCSRTSFLEIPYRRFRADLDGDNRVYKGDDTVEYLVLGKMK